MRTILIAVLLLVVAISPALADKASVEDRMGMSASISNCIHDRVRGCATNPFKTISVEIGAAVLTLRYGVALADWKSADGTKRGQVFLSTKGCQLWNVGPVSVGRALSSDELSAYLGEHLSWVQSPKQVATNLVRDLAQIDAQNVAYLRVPPGPSC